uniref:Protein kinase domain-containing protein n=1 Tax=Caenorhabditis japonica TaxID=281687 RepID=A0A8R1INT9_CAEJA
MNDMFAYNSTPNFIKMISAIIVKGQYPKGLLKAWDHYDKFCERKLQSENELRSILLQLTLSMKAAEETLEFEHRDLHLGNVLIDRSGVEKLSYRVNGHDVTMNAHGVKLSIIDFTLGRIKKGPTFVYMDLEKDPGIFTGEGDPQFEVYRKMRALCG